MALSHRNYAKVRVVAPVGRLDHDNCEAFRNDLAPHLDACLREGQALIFDLSGLEYVSSAGLRCLMLAAWGCREAITSRPLRLTACLAASSRRRPAALDPDAQPDRWHTSAWHACRQASLGCGPSVLKV